MPAGGVCGAAVAPGGDGGEPLARGELGGEPGARGAVAGATVARGFDGVVVGLFEPPAGRSRPAVGARDATGCRSGVVAAAGGGGAPAAIALGVGVGAEAEADELVTDELAAAAAAGALAAPPPWAIAAVVAELGAGEPVGSGARGPPCANACANAAKLKSSVSGSRRVRSPASYARLGLVRKTRR